MHRHLCSCSTTNQTTKHVDRMHDHSAWPCVDWSLKFVTSTHTINCIEIAVSLEIRTYYVELLLNVNTRRSVRISSNRAFVIGNTSISEDFKQFSNLCLFYDIYMIIKSLNNSIIIVYWMELLKHILHSLCMEVAWLKSDYRTDLIW